MIPELLVTTGKRLWHDALVRHPATHAWVLNLYRAGERHPEHVLDYFPIEAAPDEALRAEMTRHRADEARHAQLYERAVKLLDQPLEDFYGLDVFNNAIRACTRESFAIAPVPLMSSGERTRRVAHVLCHAHFLEKRITRSLEFHAEACARAAPGGVTSVVGSVLADEERHGRYTAEAARDLLTLGERAAVFAHHEAAERRANLLFSTRQVRRFLRRFPEVGTHTERLRFYAGALVMEGELALA